MINMFNPNLSTNKIKTISSIQKRTDNINAVQNCSDIIPSISFKALASQVKAMAEVDNNSSLGTKLNILI